MSVVTGITLHVSVSEYGTPIHAINDWLGKRGFSALNYAEDLYAGNKHPQIQLLGGGYNYFADHEEFADFVLKQDWYAPESVVLIIEPEEGPAKVFRPNFQERF
jgi:hypothetical protein